MELIYIYIKKFGGFIYEQEMQISDRFDIQLKGQKLTISKKKNYLENYYGNKVKNVSVLVGKNGSGKTTIIDILGMTRQDRIRNFSAQEDEYFLLYYLGADNKGEEQYGIELMSKNVLNNMFKNCKDNVETEEYDKSKISIGKIYKYENNNWVSTGRHFFDYIIEGKKLSELIKYVYIGETFRVSGRNLEVKGYIYKEDYISDRKFGLKTSVYKKYLTLIKCISKKIKGFECDKAKIKFRDELEQVTNEDEFEEYVDRVKELKKALFIKKINQFRKASDVEKQKSVKTGNKNEYILDLYSRYIIHTLVNGLYSICKRKKGVRENIYSIDVENKLGYIMCLGNRSSSEKEFGIAENFDIELEGIKELIDKLKNTVGIKDNEKLFLKILLRYIGSRICSEDEIEKFGYIEAFEELIEKLYGIPEKYFSKNGIEVLVKGNRIPKIEKLLEYYDECSNNIWLDVRNVYKISFELLSEGEERFLDTITKLEESIEDNKEAQLLVLLLDEPDQALHPEWSRRFMDIILEAIDLINFNGNIQLVISTHSPYLLSDILPENVFLLERKEGTRKLEIKKLNQEASCLGANIYNLMKNDFFMNNTVGEYVTKKMNDYMKKINSSALDGEELRKIEHFISRIGEPIIRKAMEKQIKEKKSKLQIMKREDEILKLITNDEDKEKLRVYFQKNKGLKYDTY